MTEEAIEMTRVPISVTLPKDLVEWLDKQVENRQYHNRSHGVEVALLKLKEGKRGV